MKKSLPSMTDHHLFCNDTKGTSCLLALYLAVQSCLGELRQGKPSKCFGLRLWAFAIKYCGEKLMQGPSHKRSGTNSWPELEVIPSMNSVNYGAQRRKYFVSLDLCNAALILGESYTHVGFTCYKRNVLKIKKCNANFYYCFSNSFIH